MEKVLKNNRRYQFLHRIFQISLVGQAPRPLWKSPASSGLWGHPLGSILPPPLHSLSNPSTTQVPLHFTRKLIFPWDQYKQFQNGISNLLVHATSLDQGLRKKSLSLISTKRMDISHISVQTNPMKVDRELRRGMMGILTLESWNSFTVRAWIDVHRAM